MADLTLPSVVLTHLNGDQPAARLPPPVTMAVCSRPASPIAAQQLSPSVTTRLVDARWAATSLLTSLLRKPLTGRSLILRGRRSSLVETAATKGCLPAAPRPRLPGRCPPR